MMKSTKLKMLIREHVPEISDKDLERVSSAAVRRMANGDSPSNAALASVRELQQHGAHRSATRHGSKAQLRR